MAISYHPIIIQDVDPRDSCLKYAYKSAERFELLNGVKPQVIAASEFKDGVNPYWRPAWVWDFAPSSAEYVLYFDAKVLPVRKLAELPELKFAASMDRHDRVNQGKACSPTAAKSGKYFQMHVFVAHRDTQPIFEQLKAFAVSKDHGIDGSTQRAIGNDARGIFTPMNELIQREFAVHELSREWNWIISYEKQYFFDWPYMINFVLFDASTWAYLRYIRQLFERIEALGGTMDEPLQACQRSAATDEV